jgi:hypothetical protein
MVAFPRLVLLALLFCVATAPSTGTAQPEEDNTYYIELFEIEADEEQQSTLYDVEVKYWELLQPLEKQLQELSQKVSELKQKGLDELYAELSAAQIESINAQRLAETQEVIARDLPFLVEFAKFASGLAKVNNIEILEGFPRRKPNEDAAVDSDALKISGFDFYVEPVTDTGTAVELLRQTATNHQFFSPTRPGGKFCGGFHPDLALRYKIDGVQHHALVCLTCYELWVLRDDTDKIVKFDFTKDARKVFKHVAESVFVNHKLTVP